MQKSKRLMHVAGGSLLLNTGYSQQFFMEVIELKRQGYDVAVLVFCGVRAFLKRTEIKKLQDNYLIRGINAYVVPSVFPGRFFLEFINFPFAWLLLLYFSFMKRIQIFHFHSCYLMFMFLPLKLIKSVKTFTDIHGVVIEEANFRNEIKENSVWHRYINFKEKLALKYTDLNFCVSQKMINYYIKKHNIPAVKFALTRSFFDPEIFNSFNWDMKEQAKKRLGLQGKKVLLYMGHKSAWHQTREIVELYANLKQQVASLFICFLTNDIENVKENCRRFKIPEADYMVKYVKHDEVPTYSYSADVAIITRADSIVNRAASPVKFSEYLASGAAVIISPTVGDLPSIVEKYGIGVVLSNNDPHDIVSFLNKLFSTKLGQQEVSEECRKIAEHQFSIHNTINVFKKYYHS